LIETSDQIGVKITRADGRTVA